jgi:hypothetical protein
VPAAPSEGSNPWRRQKAQSPAFRFHSAGPAIRPRPGPGARLAVRDRSPIPALRFRSGGRGTFRRPPSTGVLHGPIDAPTPGEGALHVVLRYPTLFMSMSRPAALVSLSVARLTRVRARLASDEAPAAPPGASAAREGRTTRSTPAQANDPLAEPVQADTWSTPAPANDPLAEPVQAERKPAIHRTPPWEDTLARRGRGAATPRTGSERSGPVPDVWATSSVRTRAQRSSRARPA